MAVAGIDFGTTNSTGGVVRGGAVSMVELGDGALATPTVLFFDAESKDFAVGHRADAALRAGQTGRYMRSLKTYLGRKDRVVTRLGGREYELEDLIAVILSTFRTALESTGGEAVDHVVMGRPVRFNDDDDALDRRAQDRLEKAAKAAGFASVSFQYEPIAAALAYEATVTAEELIVVADIGGGTSDFSIVRVGPGRQGLDRRGDILGNHGTYIGGDNFDASIIDAFVAPQMGKGTLFRSLDKRLPFPVHYFTWLARWHLFNNLLERKNLNELRSLLQVSEEPEKVGRLIELVKISFSLNSPVWWKVRKRRCRRRKPPCWTWTSSKIPSSLPSPAPSSRTTPNRWSTASPTRCTRRCSRPASPPMGWTACSSPAVRPWCARSSRDLPRCSIRDGSCTPTSLPAWGTGWCGMR